MISKELLKLSVADLVPYENNPRVISQDAVNACAESMRQCTNLDPIEVDENNVILSGHTRRLALMQLGIEEVDVVRYTGLTEAQKKKYRILANKTSEMTVWDFSKLEQELGEVDLSAFDFDFGAKDDSDAKENPYTTNINIPQYQIQGDCPTFYEMYDSTKEQELINEIRQSNITQDEKDFLVSAAHRHCRYNYTAIAEYYAHASREMQELMEKSALVIIDLDNAIANGYVKLSNALRDLISDE